ncbi:MAG: ABC transporter ATP-binding protein, partial [Clostridia bacterium]|nr:ABC transporter ATP-binding protein [Clostridia bacterium]
FAKRSEQSGIRLYVGVIMKKHLLTSSILYILSAICSAGATLLLGYLFDRVLTGTTKTDLIPAGMAAACFVLTWAFSIWGRNCNLQYASTCADIRSSHVIQTMFTQKTSDFRKKEQSVYLNILTQDISSIRVFYDNVLPLLIQDSAIVLCAFMGVGILSPWLTPLMLLGAAIAYFTSKAFVPLLEECRMNDSHCNEEAIRRIQESVNGLKDIRASGKIDDYVAKVNKTILTRIKARFKVDFVQYISFFSSGYIGMLFQMLICFAGVILSAKGLLSIGSILVAYRLYDQYRNSLSSFFEHSLTRRSAKSILEKVEQYTEDESGKPPLQNESDVISPQLQCQNLSMCYKDAFLFKGFSYSFEEGGCYVITGESGSGKTTLLKLLCGLEQASNGDVLLSGNKLDHWSEEMVGSVMSYIEQSPVIFDSTLHDNIRFGRAQNISMEKYSNILKITGLQKVGARVGDHTIKNSLSGGEQKRVAIARALAQGTKILLIDEPTSALDHASAQSMLKMLFEMKGITRIIATHDSVLDYASLITGFIDMQVVRKGIPHE